MQTIQNVSIDALHYILTFCDLETIITFAQTSGFANSLVNDLNEQHTQYLWQQLCERLKIPTLPQINWKKQYKQYSTYNFTTNNVEFTCRKCNQLVIEAVQLECGHICCKPCAIGHFKTLDNQTKSCPQCSKSLTINPRRNYALDNLLETVIDEFPIGDKLDWEHRFSAYNLDKQSRLNAIMHQIDDLSRNGGIPLFINSAWSVTDTANVTPMLKKVQDETRVQFCQVMGLTTTWLSTASETELETAQRNLNIEVSGEQSLVQQLYDIAEGETVTLQFH
jgi:hypothetical protein